MTRDTYQQYLEALASAEVRDGGLAAERRRLADIRADADRSAAALQRQDRDDAERIDRDVADLARRLRDLQRRYPVQPAPWSAPTDLAAYPAEIRAARAELDELDAADAWIRRAQQQVADQRSSTTAVAPAPVAIADPIAPSVPAPRRAGGAARYWWLAGGGGVVVVGAILLFTTLGGR